MAVQQKVSNRPNSPNRYAGRPLPSLIIRILGSYAESTILAPNACAIPLSWYFSPHSGHMKSTTFSLGGVCSSPSDGQAGQYMFSANHRSVTDLLIWEPLLYLGDGSRARRRSTDKESRSEGLIFSVEGRR